MLPKGLEILLALLATALMATFIIGLAHSISTGFAGFWGGLPFWIIAVTVLLMATFDFFQDAVFKKNK
jgi:hypothetical protein